MEPSAEAEIRVRIARLGKIPFAEFMELALYHPQDGYYSRVSVPEGRRDYYTSPAAHPAFGALLALQLRRMWELMGRPSPFYAVEMGAGSGLLARDLTEFVHRLPGAFGPALRYVTLDRAPPPLRADRWASPGEPVLTEGVPLKGVVGCFLSNELVDAFPVHRFEIRDRAAREVYVAIEGGDLVQRLDQPSTPRLARRLDRLAREAPEGYRGEVNLAIGPWMAQVSRALRRGFVLTIDYGYEEDGVFSPEMSQGAVQTYYRHTGGGDPYKRIGSQDITAHVDFSALASEGEAAGLASLGTITQARFLGGLGLGRWLQRLRTEAQDQRERDANMMAMRDLTRPDGLGGFRVLVQEKGTGIEGLGQLLPPEGAVDEMPLPLLRPDHVALMDARYPHTAWQPEELWPPS